ncbi:unnamed protein product [Durusdinium trenchii]|uniref:Uncharacterized protein n=1 Tax=Durusdinium trenchii TaxID=1381693 RepID=A0ABP0R1H7_9DINO
MHRLSQARTTLSKRLKGDMHRLCQSKAAAKGFAKPKAAPSLPGQGPAERLRPGKRHFQNALESDVRRLGQARLRCRHVATMSDMTRTGFAGQGCGAGMRPKSLAGLRTEMHRSAESMLPAGLLDEIDLHQECGSSNLSSSKSQQPVDVSTTVSMLASVLGKNTALHYESDGRRISTTIISGRERLRNLSRFCSHCGEAVVA